MRANPTIKTIRADWDDEPTVLNSIPGRPANAIELAGVLGQGGMGVVREGRQVSLGRDVAVKMPRDERSDEQQLLREAFVTSALEHPNIVPVYDLAHGEEGQPLIVMKRVEGRGWDSVLEDGPRAGERAGWFDAQLRTLVQVCHAVEFAHSRGIVHRDLKPGNVMIGDFGEVYVLDWGLAVALRPDAAGRFPLATDVRLVSGTPAYMSPEQAHAEGPRIGVRTDVYLLGSILHELLTGRAPHVSADVHESLQCAAASAPPVFDASVPEPLAAICRRAIARLPEDRFPSVAELRAAVQDFLVHRVSIELTGKARSRLEDLRRRVAGDADKDTRTLHKVFNECRFALQQALDIWPGNVAAESALQEAVELMIGEELTRGDLRYAEVLLAELRAPNAVLSARLEACRVRAAEHNAEREALARLGVEFDQRIGARGRLFLAGVFGLVFFLRPVSLGLLDRMGVLAITPRSDLLGSVAFFALFAVLLYGARTTVFSSTINRLGFGMLGLVGLGSLGMRIGALVLGYPLYVSALGLQLLEMMLFAALAFAADRRLLFGCAAYLVGFGAILAWPSVWPFASGLSNAVTLVVMLWVWWPAVEQWRPGAASRSAKGGAGPESAG